MKVVIKVPDMTCQHCRMTIENTLQTNTGVQNIQISVENHTVEVKGNFEVSEIVDLIRQAGYTAEQILKLE